MVDAQQSPGPMNIIFDQPRTNKTIGMCISITQTAIKKCLVRQKLNLTMESEILQKSINGKNDKSEQEYVPTR